MNLLVYTSPLDGETLKAAESAAGNDLIKINKRLKKAVDKAEER